MSNTEFDPDLIRRYDRPGPRYTSYPTALQFGDFPVSGFSKAIEDSPFRHRDVSLYVHLPFCATLCYYCACNKIVTKKREPAREYLAALDREIDLVAPLFENRMVSQLHWGGGTPTFLDDEQITHLTRRLHESFSFREDREGEFSIEIDPRTVDEGRIAHLRQCGFNRLSFGIQDFDEKVQAAVNRRQGFDETLSVMRAAREEGFESISVDLIYGLPFQTIESFRETLEKVATLAPDRISIYNYAHLPDRFAPQKRIIAMDLPTADNKLKILELCIDFLTDAGYVYIGMDHFALPDDELAVAQREGTLQRNFQGYSTFADCDLVGLGVTSISHVGQTYTQNEKDIDAYQDRVVDGELPLLHGIQIDHDDQVRASVIKALMCDFKLDFNALGDRFSINVADYFSDELDAFKDFIEDGLVVVTPDGYAVTERGRFLIRNICMVFDRYLKAPSGSPRYSKAI